MGAFTRERSRTGPATSLGMAGLLPETLTRPGNDIAKHGGNFNVRNASTTINSKGEPMFTHQDVITRFLLRRDRQLRRRMKRDRENAGQIIWQLSEAMNQSFLEIVENSNEMESTILSLAEFQEKRALSIQAERKFISRN